MLSGLRPFAAPFLNRVQLRMRQAVEDAALGPAMRDVAERLERVEEHLRRTVATLGALIDRSAEISRRLDGIEGQLREEVGGRLDKVEERLREEITILHPTPEAAGSSPDRQAGGGLPGAVNAVRTQLRSLQVALDSLRLEQAALGALGRDSRALLEGIPVLIGQRTDAVMQRSDTLLQRSDVLVQSSDALVQRSDTLLQRSDTLVQRVAIPLGQEVLARTPEGYLLIPTEDVPLLIAMFESGGRLEPGTVAVIQAILREGDVVLDVGANIGLTVLPAARRVGTSGRVIAVEAGSRVAGLLGRSLALNGVAERVSLHHAAAGEAPGRAVLNIGMTSGHSSLLGLPGSEGVEEVEVKPLDELVEPGTRIRLAKIDVEGYEPQAWRGMRRILAENPEMAVLVEFGPEHLKRAGITPADWMALFTGVGFTPYEVDETLGVVRPARPVQDLSALHSVNLLMLQRPVSAYPELRLA
ncbi:FkbM family methyltransferase [Muricoccus pecuniae]|uniref:FkbM family methyltransferase n=1 Tax=Muricoccus pecuniae TaxID=693023 RepID=A0A840Y506_9PROT|nr:FkbM family methyltransferase [Roseomonas pecuniae]MBB5695236.1 FkbM family methyltransferase [Roseomonas pecuniae]